MKGSCLCGSVVYEIEPPFSVFQYCHCSRCRKFTGSAHAANLFVPPTQFKWINGADQVGKYAVPEAKYFATAFCKHCGSSLPWETQGGKTMVIPTGTLDEDPGIRPQQNIFWASHADWLSESSELPKYDERPPRK
jgi:hypothetical protein